MEYLSFMVQKLTNIFDNAGLEINFEKETEYLTAEEETTKTLKVEEKTTIKRTY